MLFLMTLPTKLARGVFLLSLTLGVSSAAVWAQDSKASGCAPVSGLAAEQLYGDWQARFDPAPPGLPPMATLRLHRHAEFSESLAGTVQRQVSGAAGSHAAEAALAGDLEDGVLILDESSDRISITGTWNGEAVPGSCGKAYRGIWTDTSRSAVPDAPGVSFTLTRLPS